MMLTREQVLHIAQLARLKLSEDELVKYSSQLAGILEYIDVLNEVDTSNVEPTAQVTGLSNITDEDIIEKKTSRESLLSCSPLPVEQNQIMVKPVFE
ncbi:Asp-tRNA(Asn)/Glu-tRNA(Gln) amidotransferase subunit GatC [Candidatus Peregrinibacteria bacterium]|nr:Asp-tRNA(Asn)/Glu-tRNA(Gln) amidotransferase subunit GatC [Candidatus Peregrinibacteria bacterium]